MRTLSPGLVGGLLVLVGVGVGTLADRIPERSHVRAGNYWILSGDFHVHAFPGDGTLLPWLLRREAARAGLDVIAITNHNQLFTARLARWISNRSEGPLMIAGQEITNPGYHMIAVGIERTIDADQPAASAAGDVHAQHGVAIAAHPSSRSVGYRPDEAVRLLDGVEAAHSDSYRYPDFRAALRAFHRRASRLKPHIAAIGSSDFHAMPAIGQSRTYLFVVDRSEIGVLDAIRSGRTLAADEDGNLHGDPALVELVRNARPEGRSDAHSGWRRLSVLLTWFGALGLVLFRCPPRNS